MKTKLLRTSLIIAVLSIAFFACKKTEDCLSPQTVSLNLPETTYDYSTFNHAGVMQSSFINSEIATLGRVLFYDTHLSINNSISCGTCHKQSIAFSDNKAFSSGFENHSTLRNTLPIQNLSNSTFQFGGSPSLFWDGRATMLQTMVLMPITNHVEMGMSDADAIVEKVKNIPYYKDLFINAFGTEEITSSNVGTALSTFVGAIFSGNTRFDLFMNNTVQLSGIEKEGHDLFFNKYNCNSCHQTQQLNGYEMGGGFVNIGLDEVYTDKGHENVTNLPADNGTFKIPNLRNIALTGPYMHDGRFATLSDVIDHYSHGISDTPGLDPRLRDASTGNPMRMNITDHEKTALIAFLNTMTDYAMITDAKFSNPFKAK